MKTRWKILIALGVFLVLMAASLLVNGHYQPANALEAYKKSLRDRGEKLEISEVLPPPVPDESNAVDAVRSAFAAFVSGDAKSSGAMLGVAPAKAMLGWAQQDARGYDFTNTWEDFAAAVEADRPALELLLQVLEKPRLDFHLDYKQGATLLLPHLAPLKHCSQHLTAAAVCNLHYGNVSEATTNILTILALVKKSVYDPLLISHLVRIAMTSIAVTPTWELLQTTNVTDTQLAALQAGWEQLDFLSDATNSFVMERAWGINEIQKLRGSNEEFQKLAGSYSSLFGGGSSASGGWDWETITEKPRNAIGVIMWRSSWSYEDELCALKANSIILETLRAMQTNRSQSYKTNLDAMSAQLASLKITNVSRAFFHTLKIADWGDLFGNEGTSLGNAVKKTVRIEATRRVVVTAIALKRFELKHGKLPENIAGLAPEILAAVPIDPFDGQPLRYRPNGNGTFLLYCVGEDGVDNGGDASQPTGASTYSSYGWQNPRALDWVWPQPATAAEIEIYYEEQAKKAR